MTDEQKVLAAWRDFQSELIRQLAAIVTGHTPDYLYDLNAIQRDPVMAAIGHIRRAMNAFDKQSALSHASATVEECEAAGEESCKRCGGTGEVVEHCWEHDQIVKCPDCNHSPRAAEDATGWREMDSAPADKAIMGAWFGSPEYTEVSPVIYCSERGKWMNPDDMRDDEYTMPDMWHPYPSAPPHRAIDQAIAGKRGGE